MGTGHETKIVEVNEWPKHQKKTHNASKVIMIKGNMVWFGLVFFVCVCAHKRKSHMKFVRFIELMFRF